MKAQTEIVVDQATELISQEWKRREDLINDIEFRKTCVEGAKKMGITSEEWNANKAVIIMMFANKFCSMENEMQRPLEVKF
jgi:hypothetical protein